MKTLRLPASASFLVLLTALAACGDDSSTSSGTGGGGSQGGATSSSTSTGTVASTSSTSSTSSTTGGSGGEGGGGGGTAIDAHLADCLRIDACDADGGRPRGVEACLAHALETQWTWASFGPGLHALQVMECKLAAEDCATVRACDPDPQAFAAACVDNPGASLCEDDVWLLCDDLGAPLAALDCAAADQACGTDIWAGCGTERCTFGETPSACDPEDPSVLIECSPAGFITRVDCRTQNNFVLLNGPEGEERFTIAGEVCGEDVQRGALGCIGTGEACDFFSQECDGDVLQTCAGGTLGRRDCGEATPDGQSCGFVQSGAFAGGAACGLVAPACELAIEDEQCDEGTIRFCGYQGPESVDCRAAGYTGCAVSETGGRQIAHCTP